MKITRVSASVLTFAALSLLAACGGGGGGGGFTPPGGGGGGSNPPTATPTPVVTATPTPAGIGVSNVILSAEENFINGDNSWYTSGTSSWSNHAGDPANAPTGAVTDTMSCTHVTEGTQFPADKFSQHAFVGIYFNGTEEAFPQALGMSGPVNPIGTGNPPHTHNTDEVEDNTCEYNIHTHDFSGLIHVEDENFTQGNTFPAYATLQALLDVSGFTLSNAGLTAGGSSLNGNVTIYTGTPSTKNGGNDLVNSYSVYNGSAAALQFTKHEVVWLVIGTPPAALPQVQFVIVN